MTRKIGYYEHHFRQRRGAASLESVLDAPPEEADGALDATPSETGVLEDEETPSPEEVGETSDDVILVDLEETPAEASDQDGGVDAASDTLESVSSAEDSARKRRRRRRGG